MKKIALIVDADDWAFANIANTALIRTLSFPKVRTLTDFSPF